jgi:uncharacterized ferredoxin-like protein
MDWDKLSDNERLVAEQAVAAYRTATRAMRQAPHGHGLDRIEQAVRDEGFESLRKMVELAASEHDEAQKKGPAAGRVGAAGS